MNILNRPVQDAFAIAFSALLPGSFFLEPSCQRGSPERHRPERFGLHPFEGRCVQVDLPLLPSSVAKTPLVECLTDAEVYGSNTIFAEFFHDMC